MSANTQEGLYIDNLTKYYQNRAVVDGLSLEVRPGEIVGLLGPNGAGKTTAFYMVMGLIRPDKGRVLFNEEDITACPIDVRARKGLGYLAQEPSVFRDLTVEENILAVLEMHMPAGNERNERLAQLLEELHLTHLAKKKAQSLSGGERRRLEITRALVSNPKCFLLDEPFANIDPIAISEVQQLIRHLAMKNIGVLITDHNARELFSIVDRGYLVNHGKVLMAGTLHELLANPEARMAYFGEGFKL